MQIKLKAILMLIGLITITSCVLPEGDEYEKVYYSVSTKYRLVVGNSDGSDIKEALVLHPYSEWNRMTITCFTKDDQNIFLANNKKIYVLDTTNLAILKYKDLDFANIYEFAFNPDVQTIVFAARKESHYWDLFSVNPTDLTIRNLTNTPNSLERFPSFTEDGQNIVYSSLEFGQRGAIIKLNLTNGATDTLITASSPNSKPDNYKFQFISPFLDISDSILYYVEFFTRNLISHSLILNSKRQIYWDFFV